MQGQTNKFTKPAAKQLRKTLTDAEKQLWHRLRGEQLGAKFRRQHPFENYVLDFVCLDRRLNETDAVVQAIWDGLNPSPPQPSP
jgi:very-short-patch-repair endonuclease